MQTMDKTRWGPGPWQEEPDEVFWRDEATGLPCHARRNASVGSWCGYVGVPVEHPAFGEGYTGIGNAQPTVHTHGGITYAGGPRSADFSFAVLLANCDGMSPDKTWWFGFDCAHSHDYCPGLDATMRRQWDTFDRVDSVYRTLDFVKIECRELAQQLATFKASQTIMAQVST